MVVVCLRNKFGFCKFGKTCNKIHLEEMCYEKAKACIGKVCEKRHPVDCNFYRNFGRCKFGEYCSYRHPQKEESPAEKEVLELKLEVSKLKSDIDELKGKVKSLENVLNDIKKDDKKQTRKFSEAIATKPIKDKELKESEDKSLEDIIRENSDGSTSSECDLCAKEFSSSKKMKVHKAKWHTKVDPGCKHRSKNGFCTDNNGRLPCGTIHKRIFKQPMLWQCLICGKKSMDKEIHIKEDHSYLDEETIWRHQFKISV